MQTWLMPLLPMGVEAAKGMLGGAHAGHAAAGPSAPPTNALPPAHGGSAAPPAAEQCAAAEEQPAQRLASAALGCGSQPGSCGLAPVTADASESCTLLRRGESTSRSARSPANGALGKTRLSEEARSFTAASSSHRRQTWDAGPTPEQQQQHQVFEDLALPALLEASGRHEPMSPDASEPAPACGADDDAPTSPAAPATSPSAPLAADAMLRSRAWLDEARASDSPRSSVAAAPTLPPPLLLDSLEADAVRAALQVFHQGAAAPQHARAAGGVRHSGERGSQAAGATARLVASAAMCAADPMLASCSTPDHLISASWPARDLVDSVTSTVLKRLESRAPLDARQGLSWATSTLYHPSPSAVGAAAHAHGSPPRHPGGPRSHGPAAALSPSSSQEAALGGAGAGALLNGQSCPPTLPSPAAALAAGGPVQQSLGSVSSPRWRGICVPDGSGGSITMPRRRVPGLRASFDSPQGLCSGGNVVHASGSLLSAGRMACAQSAADVAHGEPFACTLEASPRAAVATSDPVRRREHMAASGQLRQPAQRLAWPKAALHVSAGGALETRAAAALQHAAFYMVE